MRRVLLGLLACGIGASACVPHPVGPARTYGKYEGKAVTTAESALSTVETVRLAAGTASKDHAFGPYLSELVSDMEESASGVQGTFESIQPPDERADQLRDDLDQLLSDVVDHIAAVRVAVRRGRILDLDQAAQDLDEDSQKLNDFAEEHKR
ncbi:MAG TPA: hypothetical protein VGO92_04280 [Acidimicrobiales bacterium]|jgi:ABC-type glycerol-3-phosphate transport system substrate-binding protein|nr:hypothetical protein [Acidimicrobiales bacterium]